MKLPLSLLAICILLLINFIACTDEPSSIGVDLLEGDFVIVATFDTQDDSVYQSSSDFKEVISLGFASRILIGKRGDVHASTLMRFIFAITDTLRQDFLDGNIHVNESIIDLDPIYTYNDTLETYDFTVHEITNDWTSAGFTSDSLPSLTYEPIDLSSNKNFTDSLYSFNLDNDLVLSWIKFSIESSQGSNKGIYYKPTESSGKVVGFQALTLTSTTAARLNIVIEKTGSWIDTINGFIFEDVSVTESDNSSLPEEVVGIQSSVTFQSRLFFDVSEADSDVVVNNAELILTSDSLNTVTGSPFNSNLTVFRMTDSTSNAFDESFNVTLSKVGNLYIGDITSFVNFWLNTRDNHGLLIRSQSYTEGLELFAFKGSSSPLLSERPRLKIVFTRLQD
ncbi:MAG: hypothetical protein JSW63_09860 [Ignavibacterium sp.]|nr:MAG: hypothetical protein JSW63_09860 [Ignavibacterium sp.]